MKKFYITITDNLTGGVTIVEKEIDVLKSSEEISENIEE